MRVKLIEAVVALATTNEIIRINTESAVTAGLQIKNSGANPFDVFDIVGRVHEDATDVTLLTLAADYSGPLFPCIRAVGAPVTLASNLTAWMVIDVSAFTSIAIRASSGVGASKMDVYGTIKFR